MADQRGQLQQLSKFIFGFALFLPNAIRLGKIGFLKTN